MSSLVPSEVAAAMESIRADAARASAAAERASAAVDRSSATLDRNAPTVSQGVQRVGQGVQQVGESAPGFARGVQTIGPNIGRVGQGISQTAESIRDASDTARGAEQRAGSFFRIIAALVLGCATAATVLVIASTASDGPKSNRRYGRSHARKCRASRRRGGKGRSHAKRCP